MKSTLAPGLSKTRTIEVDRNRTISFLGEDLRVYATPELLRDVEVTARELLLEHVEAGEDSVGTRVEMAHLAAAPLGVPVEITVRVTDVDRRRVTFAFSAKDAVDEIANGTHSRFVVDMAKTTEQIANKIAKLKSL